MRRRGPRLQFARGCPQNSTKAAARRLLLGNADVRLSYVVADAVSPHYRNAIGDECLYVESGEAVVETVFGDLEVADGDYEARKGSGIGQGSISLHPGGHPHDAAVFPPGSLPLTDAVPAHFAHHASAHATMVGPFVLAAKDLDQAATPSGPSAPALSPSRSTS